MNQSLHFLASQCAIDIPLPVTLLQHSLQASDEAFQTAIADNIANGIMLQLPVGLILLPEQPPSSLEPAQQSVLLNQLLDEAAKEAKGAMRHHSKLVQLTDIREIGPHLYNLASVAKTTHHPRATQLWTAFGDYLMAVAKYEDAQEAFRTAMVCDNENPVQTEREKLRLTRKLGDAAFGLKDLDNAELYYLNAAILCKQIHGKESPRPAQDYENLGKTAFKRADYEKSIQLYQKALHLEETYGKSANLVASRCNNLGRVFQAAGQLEQALTQFERAHQLWENEGSSDHHVNQALALKNMGVLYQEMGNLDKAQTCLEEAIQRSEAHYGPDHSDIGRDANLLALILQEQGKLDEALGQFRRALRIDIETFGINHPEVALTLNNMGMLFVAAGDLQKALDNLQQAMDILKQTVREDHPYRVQVVDNIEELKRLL